MLCEVSRLSTKSPVSVLAHQRKGSCVPSFMGPCYPQKLIAGLSHGQRTSKGDAMGILHDLYRWAIELYVRDFYQGSYAEYCSRILVTNSKMCMFFEAMSPKDSEYGPYL